MIKYKNLINTLLATAMLTACGVDSNTIDDTPDPVEPTYTTMLQRHTTGGAPFTIIIMADGYTEDDIADGTYRAAVEKARKAIFNRQPMASLEQYCDVVEHRLVSEQSGIQSVARNTALRSYYDTETTRVFYNENLLSSCIEQAITNAYGYTAGSTNMDWQKLNTLVVVLLNANVYKGMTSIEYLAEESDIPMGLNTAFVPVEAYVGTRDVFEDLIQHEAVGHGISMLADEYSGTHLSSVQSVTTQKAIESLDNDRKYGISMNVHYHDLANPDPEAPTDHAIEEDDWIYPFTLDALYQSENLSWYTGGYTYSSFFFRPTYHSTMNATSNVSNTAFNVPSRAMIYKRIMRTANGNGWKFDYSTFVNFDTPSRTRTEYGKRAMASTRRSPAAVDSVPELTAPVKRTFIKK